MLFIKHLYFIVVCLFTLSACNVATKKIDNSQAQTIKNHKPLSRWYNKKQVTNGAVVYKKHCIACHQPDATGVKSYNYKDANGHYPAPPLNGKAHTWHHPIDSLRLTVRNGGKSKGGTMPGFANSLNSQQIDEVLAWAQSHWSDDIYAAWLRKSKQAQKNIH